MGNVQKQKAGEDLDGYLDAGKKAIRNSTEIWELEDKGMVIKSEQESEWRGKNKRQLQKQIWESENLLR